MRAKKNAKWSISKNRKELNRKPNRILVDRDREIYNRSIKSWLKCNDVDIYLKENERKSVLPELFIKTLYTKLNKRSFCH